MSRSPGGDVSRWMDESYTGLRNAAWFVRNARVLGQDENLQRGKLCIEARRLVEAGESLESIVRSLVELFVLP